MDWIEDAIDRSNKLAEAIAKPFVDSMEAVDRAIDEYEGNSEKINRISGEVISRAASPNVRNQITDVVDAAFFRGVHGASNPASEATEATLAIVREAVLLEADRLAGAELEKAVAQILDAAFAGQE